MFLEEIDSLLRKRLSPEEFKINNEFYGLQYGNQNLNSVLKKVMLTTDLNLESIHFAILNKINLIISLRSLINKPIDCFNKNLINKLSLLSRYPLSIFVLNSSLIAVEGGISDIIREILYLNLEKTFDIVNLEGNIIPIGRICSPKNYPNQKSPLKLEDLLNRIKINFELDKIHFVGNLKKKITKVNIIGGVFPDIKYLEESINIGCDCFISCDFNYGQALYARELDLCLIKIPHYSCEMKTMKRLCNILSLEFPYDDIFLYESENPINVY